jgi:hypothetical protein
MVCSGGSQVVGPSDSPPVLEYCPGAGSVDQLERRGGVDAEI